jgi:hypothetical protein
VTPIFSYTIAFKPSGKYRYTRIYMHTILSALCAYKSSEPLGNYNIRIISNMTSYENNAYNITILHTYGYSEPLGNTSILALPTLNHRKSIQRNILAIYIFISSEPLEHTCIHTLQNFTSQQVNQRHNSVAHA